jgi:hypothetical protein
MRAITAVLALALALPAVAQQSTLGEGDSYAWAGNLGWIEMTPHRPAPGEGFRFGEFSCSGYLWSPAIGWIFCGDGTPADGVSYANDDAGDFGVNHFGTGDLSGLAWSASVGWINFGWATLEPNHPNRPRVDLYSGEFSGYAWSANCGWITLGSGYLKTDSMAVVDSDGDGISDAFEMAYAGGLEVMSATSDMDGDGFSDRAEYLALTNPLDPQSYLRITRTELKNADGSAVELEWVSSPARRYAIEQVDNLGGIFPWQSSPLDPASFSPDPGPRTRRTIHGTPTDRRFFRVRALVPLQP